MDPIHPIVPQPPTIAPVPPAPMAGRIDRERRREPDSGGGQGRRKRPDAKVDIHGTSADATDQSSWEDYDVSDYDEQGESGLHVDIEA
jgi:hypothetical protein